MADLSGYSPIYVRTTGNDSTGNGSSGSPYRTAQKAFEAAYAGTGNKVLDFGAGNFGGVNLNLAGSDIWPARIAVRGVSSTQSFLGGVNGDGLDETYIPEESYVVNAPQSGYNITIISNKSINIGNVTSTGGSSGYIASGNGGTINLTDVICENITTNGGLWTGQYGLQYAGSGGSVTLNNCISQNVTANGGNSQVSDPGGHGGSIILVDSTTGNVYAEGGSSFGSLGGNGGTISLTNCNIIAAYVSGGFSNTSGSNGTITDNGNNTGYWNNIFYFLSVPTTLNINGSGVWNGSVYVNKAITVNIPSTIYVRTSGNDSSGDGSINNPIASAQTAFLWSYNSSGNRILDFGSGNFGGINLVTANASGWPSRISVHGISNTQSFLGNISGNGAAQVYDYANDVQLTSALPGLEIHITGDNSINLGNIYSSGGGAVAGSYSGPAGGSIYLNNITANDIYCVGGSTNDFGGGPGGFLSINNSYINDMYNQGGNAYCAGGKGGVSEIINSTINSVDSSRGNSTDTNNFCAVNNDGSVIIKGRCIIGSGITNSSVSTSLQSKGKGLYGSDILSLPSQYKIVPASLLLNFDENIIDSSVNALVVTANGNAQISTEQQLHNNRSLLLPSYNDFISVPYSPSFDFADGDFTIETWLYPVGNDAYQWAWAYTNNYPNGWAVYYGDTCGLGIGANKSSGWWSYCFGGSGLYNQWIHLAIVRFGKTTTGYINGIAIGSTQGFGNEQITAENGGLTIVGRDGETYMNELRIVKGVAVYKESFVPPSQPLLNRIPI